MVYKPTARLLSCWNEVSLKLGNVSKGLSLHQEGADERFDCDDCNYEYICILASPARGRKKTTCRSLQLMITTVSATSTRGFRGVLPKSTADTAIYKEIDVKRDARMIFQLLTIQAVVGMFPRLTTF